MTTLRDPHRQTAVDAECFAGDVVVGDQLANERGHLLGGSLAMERNAVLEIVLSAPLRSSWHETECE